MRVGVFGGSFNPPHVGHRIIAELALEALRLEHLVWMPASRSPFKNGREQAPATHRLAMTRLCADNHPAFSVSDLEIRRTPPSYTVDTLRALREEHPDWDPVLLMGEDSWRSFDRWKQPEVIRQLASIAVYPRGINRGSADEPVQAGGSEGTPVPRGIAGDSGPEPVVLLDAPRTDISSSLIRSRLAEGKPIAGLVPREVQEYITAHGLYRDTDDRTA